jgi:hypothetical protein
MARKVPFKARGRKSNLQEALVLCLNQKRHDSAGNRIKGSTFDEIAAMGPEEREQVRQAGWLGQKSNRR